MDFSNRTQHHVAAAAPESAAVVDGAKRRKSFAPNDKAWRIVYFILLVAIAVLLVALSLRFYFNGNGEYGYVNTKAFQAVDINVGGANNTDQLYFGNIKSLNSGYLVLENVYYIQSSSSSSSSGLSLQPLVCQIDAPYNRMVVNRGSVNWWENLQDSGKVVQAIKSYQKTNPNGPNCSTASSSSTSNGSSSSSTTPSSSSTSSSTSTAPAAKP